MPKRRDFRRHGAELRRCPPIAAMPRGFRPRRAPIDTQRAAQRLENMPVACHGMPSRAFIGVSQPAQTPARLSGCRHQPCAADSRHELPLRMLSPQRARYHARAAGAARRRARLRAAVLVADASRATKMLTYSRREPSSPSFQAASTC